MARNGPDPADQPLGQVGHHGAERDQGVPRLGSVEPDLHPQVRGGGEVDRIAFVIDDARPFPCQGRVAARGQVPLKGYGHVGMSR